MLTIIRRFRSQFYEPPIPVEELGKYRLRENEIAHLWGTETVHPPLFNVPMHSHNAPSFYVVLEGSLSEINKANRRELKSCSVVFTPPGEIHSNIFHKSGGRCFLVELQSHWTERLAKLHIELEPSLEVNDGEVAWLATRMYKEFRYPDNVSPLVAEGIALEILAAFSRKGTKPPKFSPTWLRIVQQLIHDRFSETVRLDEVAGAVGVHPVHLARAFRQRYSCSIGDYQRRLRVEHASRLLTTTKVSLVEVALSSGFSDQAHFTRVFKKLTGMTPAVFRQVWR